MEKIKKFSNLISATLIATIVCFILVVLLIILLVLPKIQMVRQVQEDIKNAKLELKNKEAYVASLDQLKIKLEENKEVVDKIKTTLPEDPAVPSILNFLQKTAAKSGLVLSEISPFTVSTSNEFMGLKETTLSFKLVGTFPSFKNFVLNLDRSARLIEIEDISFSAVAAETSSEAGETVVQATAPSKNITFSLKIKTFSY